VSSTTRERRTRGGAGTAAAAICAASTTDLASLFRVILNQVQDSGGGVETAALTAPVQGAVSNHARVEHWYGAHADGPPWSALIGDALDQLQQRKLIERDDGGPWRTGPKFTTGKKLAIIQARKGRHGAVGLTLYSAAEREARGLAEKQRMEITSLAGSLREDSPGLRPLAPEHVDTLERSMRDYGYRAEFPILVDQHDRILDGRHRMAAARRAGIPEPLPKRKVTVASDEEAVGFAILVNLQRGWTKAERGRIDSDLRAAGLTVENFGRQLGASAKRELIAAALLEQAALDKPLAHRAIAKRLNVHPELVNRACQELMTQCVISECGHRFTEDGKQAPGPKPKTVKAAEGSRKADSPELLDRHEQIDEQVSLLREQGLTQKEIAATTGETFNVVQDAYQRLEGEQRGMRKASPPTPVEVPSGEEPVPGEIYGGPYRPSEVSRDEALQQILTVLLSVSPEDRAWLLMQIPAQVDPLLSG
jgi:ParB-like chromosome segregation protein Spo0J